MENKHWQNGSFTVGFSFSNGIAYCEGFSMETVVSDALKLKYRMLVKHPIDGEFWTMKGMEEAMSQDEIHEIIKERHNGSISGKEFAFEVFNETGEKKLFATRFDASEKIPTEGYGSEHLVVTSFSWSFELPEELQILAKSALEDHERKIREPSQPTPTTL